MVLRAVGLNKKTTGNICINALIFRPCQIIRMKNRLVVLKYSINWNELPVISFLKLDELQYQPVGYREFTGGCKAFGKVQ